MTPRVRFRRALPVISILGLTLNMIRIVLLPIFYPSAWLSFYALFTMDYSFVPRVDYGISVAATALSIPVTMLIIAAFVVQAWSIIQLWQPVYRWGAAIFLLALVFFTIGFNFAGSIIQAKAILNVASPAADVWVRKTYLSLITISICWLYFLFNARLVMHMWSNRSILPSLKGLKAMDVLVITNGILMFVPGMFFFFVSFAFQLGGIWSANNRLQSSLRDWSLRSSQTLSRHHLRKPRSLWFCRSVLWLRRDWRLRLGLAATRLQVSRSMSVALILQGQRTGLEDPCL